MVVFPNAKINIGLDILRKRPDGYHDIVTVMAPIPWTDVLEIVPSNGLNDTLTVSGREMKCAPEQNLVMKAVKALRGKADFPIVDIFLSKIIPDGAGLGGGSADAAFTLKALNEMFELNFSADDLAAIAAGLGADCPFFIYNRPMICRGTGTEMATFNLNLPKGLTIVVVKPQVSVPTKEAYSAVLPAVPEVDLAERLSFVPFEEWQNVIANDFEVSVFSKYPEIAEVKKQLENMGAKYVAMSGSGSSVFGLFNDGDIMADDVSSCFEGCDILVKQMA